MMQRIIKVEISLVYQRERETIYIIYQWLGVGESENTKFYIEEEDDSKLLFDDIIINVTD